MTPPKVDKVNIQALNNLYLENLTGLDPRQQAAQFRGTDLILDTKTGELRQTGPSGVQGTSSIEMEAAWVQTIRDADTNGDQFIDATEAQNVLSANLAAEQAAPVDPQKFLSSIDLLMKNRYNPLAKNMKEWSAELAFKPTLDAIEMYNRGLYIDEVRQAQSVFPLNGLTKTGTNVVLFLPSLAHKIWGSNPLLMGDALAESRAEKNFEARKEAISQLKAVINEGVRKNEAWALSGNLSEALKKLDGSTVSTLNDHLALNRLHEILNLADGKERYQKLMDFAKGERAGFLGFGGGNTTDRSFWNYTGTVNNLYFTRSVMEFLTAKATSGDAGYDQTLHDEARGVRKDMLGDGGGFANIAAVGLTNIFCLGGKLCSTTPYREWGDEDELSMVGRTIDGALMIWGGNKFLGAASEAWKLRGLKGLGEVGRITLRDGTLFRKTAEQAALEGPKLFQPWTWLRPITQRVRPFPVGSWKDARIAAEKEAELLAQESNQASKATSRFGKAWERLKGGVKEWAFKGLPPMTPEMRAVLKSAGAKSLRSGSWLTRAVVIIGITQYADNKQSAYYNPFDLDYQADLDRYPDPTKPDPLLRPTKK